MTSVGFKFQPSSLLWRTRGKHWDFEFVSTPSSPKLDAWWLFFKEIFNESQVDEQPKLYYGKLILAKEEVRWYLAVACFDESRKDWTGRRIQHFLVWFPDGIELIQSIEESIPADWYNQILNHLNPFLDSEDVFNLSEEEISQLSLPDEKLGSLLKKKYDARVSPFELNTDPTVELSNYYRRDLSLKADQADEKAYEQVELVTDFLNQPTKILDRARRRLTNWLDKLPDF